MDFGRTEEHRLMVSAVKDIASDFDEDYWREVRADNRMPLEFHERLAEGGWLGIPFPEEYGGQGMGLLEHVIVIEALAEAGAWIGANGMVTGTIFGGLSILAHGDEETRQEYLPAIADGQLWALGVTEPEAGLNTANITTFAERDGDEYVINGQKQWTSGMNHADQLLLLTRTTKKEDADSPYDGLTMFICDPQDPAIEYSEIPLDIYFTEKTYQVHIDDLRVPESAILGEKGKGLRQIFATLNTERVTTAAQNWGAGLHTLNVASEHAKNRVVWSEPIGAHQAIQHPLADAYADLETARLAIEKAAWQYDHQEGDVGEASNIANLQAGKAAFAAAEAAMTTLGGMSASSEMGVAAAWEFIRHSRSVPVSEEMIRNYLGTHSLGLPRSYDPA
jgi:acyl-CoA dehydrogenase